MSACICTPSTGKAGAIMEIGILFNLRQAQFKTLRHNSSFRDYRPVKQKQKQYMYVDDG